MFAKGIKGGKSQSIDRYAKANDKYMKNSQQKQRIIIS